MGTNNLPLELSAIGSLVLGAATPVGQPAQSGPAVGTEFGDLVQKLIEGLGAEVEADKPKAGQQAPEPERKEEKTEAKDGSEAVLAQAQCLLGSVEAVAAPPDVAPAGNPTASSKKAPPVLGGEVKSVSVTTEGVVPAEQNVVQPQGSEVPQEKAAAAPAQPQKLGASETVDASRPNQSATGIPDVDLPSAEPYRSTGAEAKSDVVQAVKTVQVDQVDQSKTVDKAPEVGPPKAAPVEPDQEPVRQAPVEVRAAQAAPETVQESGPVVAAVSSERKGASVDTGVPPSVRDSNPQPATVTVPSEGGVTSAKPAESNSQAGSAGTETPAGATRDEVPIPAAGLEVPMAAVENRPPNNTLGDPAPVDDAEAVRQAVGAADAAVQPARADTGGTSAVTEPVSNPADVAQVVPNAAPRTVEADRKPMADRSGNVRRSKAADPVAASVKPTAQSAAPQAQVVEAASGQVLTAGREPGSGQDGLELSTKVAQPESRRAEAHKDSAPMEADRSGQLLETAQTKQPPAAAAVERPVAANHTVAAKVVNQIVTAAKLNVTSTGADMTLRLDPPHLGVVHMNVAASQGSVTATIQTSTEAARELVQADLTTLKQALADAGITIDSIRVSVGGNPNPGWNLNSGDQNGANQDQSSRSARHIPQAVLRDFGRGMLRDTGLVSSGRFDYLA